MGTTPQTQPTLSSVEALSRLLDIGNGYVAAQAMFAGLHLGVFEHLAGGPLTAEELSSRAGIHPLGGRRLLGALCYLGLVERADGRFVNTELGAHCTSKAPLNFSALTGAEIPFYHMCEFLTDAVRELAPRWMQAMGAPSNAIFEAMYADPVQLRRFAALMYLLSVPQGQLVAERYDFSRHRCIMDVAGGPGGIAIQVGLRHSHLTGIIADMAPVCAVAEEHIQANGLSGRFRAIPFDLFQAPYPDGADVITLGYILHDWSDANCRKILRNCFEALPSGGILLVCEKVLNEDHSGTRQALMLDLMMLVVCEPGARERNLAEYRALLEEAGFRDVELVRLDAPRDLVVARKP